VDAQREGHVLERGGVGQQVEVLVDHADAAARLAQLARTERGQFPAGDGDAAAVGFFQQVHQTQQGRLAGAAAADQAEDLARQDVERDLAQGVEAAAFGQREGLAGARDADDRSGGRHGGLVTSRASGRARGR